jgi:hypothetical protein
MGVRNIVLVALTVGVLLTLSACGSSAPSNVSAVRAVATQVLAAEHADNGGAMCALMTVGAQQTYAKMGVFIKAPKATTCAAVMTVLVRSAKWTETLAQAEHAIATAPVVVHGSSATITALINGRSGKVVLVLSGGQWRVTATPSR